MTVKGLRARGRTARGRDDGRLGKEGAMEHILFPETSGPPTARGHAYPPCRASQSSQPEVTPFQWVMWTAKQGWAQSWPSDRSVVERNCNRLAPLRCSANRIDDSHCFDSRFARSCDRCCKGARQASHDRGPLTQSEKIGSADVIHAEPRRALPAARVVHVDVRQYTLSQYAKIQGRAFFRGGHLENKIIK